MDRKIIIWIFVLIALSSFVNASLVLDLGFNNNINDISGNNINSSYRKVGFAGYDFKLNQNSNDVFGTLNGYDDGVTYNYEGVTFDGINDNITIGNNETFDNINTTGQTIAIWLKSKYNINNNRIIDIEGRQYLEIIDNRYNFKIYNTEYVQTTGNVYTENELDFIVINWNGTSINFYSNGILINSTNTDSAGSVKEVNRHTSIGSEWDGAGNEYNGTIERIYIYNTSLTTEEILILNNSGNYSNNAISFNGIDEEVVINNNSAINFQAKLKNFTITAWIKPNKDAFKLIADARDGDNDGWHIAQSTSNKFRISINTVDAYSDDNSLTIGEWNFIVGVFDTSGNITTYVNGLKNGTPQDVSGQTLNTNVNQINIGHRLFSGGGSEFYNGSIDKVKIYDSILTPLEIYNLYYDLSINNNLSSYTTTIRNNFSVSINYTNIEGHVSCGLYDNSSNLSCSLNSTVNNKTVSICTLDNTLINQDVNFTPFCYNSTNEFNATTETKTIKNYGEINFSARYYINGSNVSDFSIIYDLGTFEASGNFLQVINYINFLDSYVYYHPYTVALLNASLTTITESQNYSFIVYEVNSINFTFKDENTNNIINFTNVSYELISEVFANNYTTDTGYDYLSLLTPASYTIRYSATNYSERLYYFVLTNRTVRNLTLYLINDTYPTEVTATVIDEVGNYLEGAYIKVLKYDINTNTYNIVEIVSTNFNGQAILNLELNSEFYKFIIEYPSGTTRLITNPTYIYTTTISFQILIGEEVGLTHSHIYDINFDLIFNNDTNNFRYSFNDAQNTAYGGCLYVYRSNSLGDSSYNSSCTYSSSGTILISVENLSGVTYKAQAYILLNEGVETYLDTLYHTFFTENNVGNLGVLLIIIMVVVFASMGFWSPVVAVILTPIPLSLGVYMGLLNISFSTLIGLHLISIIIAFVIMRKY